METEKKICLSGNRPMTSSMRSTKGFYLNCYTTFFNIFYSSLISFSFSNYLINIKSVNTNRSVRNS
jgi:hypothetical protein